MTCWWLGINNHTKRRGSARVVLYHEIADFINGRTQTFDWPARGNRKSCYARMNPGDPVLLWMGHNPSSPESWGLIARAEIGRIDKPWTIQLTRAVALPKPLQPHAIGATPGIQSRTPVSEFLLGTFGPEFSPLFDVYTRLGYLAVPRHSIVTVHEVAEAEYERVLACPRKAAA